jgi:hypothetical protein
MPSPTMRFLTSQSNTREDHMAKIKRVFHNLLEQGSEEWFLTRMGRVTASEFKTVLAKGKGGKPSKGRRTYMLKLMGERFTGQPMDSFNGVHMDRGKEQEPEARLLYEMTTGNEVEQVGFVAMGDDIGYSPDGLVSSDGSVEIKCRLAHIQLELALADKEGKAEVPGDAWAQCQGGLWVAEREWLDYVSYCPGLPEGANIIIIRVKRDEKFIGEISAKVNRFLAEMNELMEIFK